METIKTNTGETVNVTPVIDWKARAQAAENRNENIELALICAQDIVNAWPTLTIRTLGSMTKRIETLSQALAASK